MCPARYGLLSLIWFAVLLSLKAADSHFSPPTEPERAFLAASQTSMREMMAGMGKAPQGDVDQGFIGQMIPHHQGAIDGEGGVTLWA